MLHAPFCMKFYSRRPDLYRSTRLNVKVSERLVVGQFELSTTLLACGLLFLEWDWAIVRQQ